MPYTRKQIVTCVSLLYLLLATGLAGYASSRANARSVPIPDVLAGFATALPIVAGLLLECGYDLTRRQERRQHLSRGEIKRPPLVILVNAIIFIYSTVVITLLGTHAAPPAGLDCGLQERWQTLYHLKDAEAIKKIQDAFDCCGLKNPRDMPYPFPGKTITVDTCKDTFNRRDGCMDAWKAEEQQMAGMLMTVVAMVFIWQFLIIVTPTQPESWLHQVVPDRVSRVIADERGVGGNGVRRSIEYAHASNRYTDRIEEEEEEPNDTVNAIEEGNRRLNGALPSHLEQDHEPNFRNEWARE